MDYEEYTQTKPFLKKRKLNIERSQTFTQHIFHLINTTEIKERSEGGVYRILCQSFHSSGKDQNCAAGPHYHALVQCTDEHVMYQKEKHQKILGHFLKTIPIYTDDAFENTVRYIEKYEVITPLRNEEAKLSLMKKPRTWMDAADEKLEKNRIRKLELDEMFSEGKKSFNELMRKYGRMLELKNKLIHDYTEWKQMLALEDEVEKLEPATQEDLDIIYQNSRTANNLRKIARWINLHKQSKKCPIIFIVGVASAGKTFEAKIIADAIGTSHNLNDHQLWNDNLVLDDVCKKGADVLIFEEFQFSNKQGDVSKALQQLKMYTSGRELAARTCKSGRQNKSIDTYKIEAIIIVSNHNAEIIHNIIKQDEGVLARAVIVQYLTPIPENERTEQDLLYQKYQVPMIKWMKHCLEQDITDEEEDSKDIRKYVETGNLFLKSI